MEGFYLLEKSNIFVLEIFNKERIRYRNVTTGNDY